MSKAKIIAAVVVIAIIVIVFLQNRQPVQFTFLFLDPVSIPKTILILGSALLGAIATLIIQFVWRHRRAASQVPSGSSPLVS
jgi:uncharacterized integral membrane protein